MTASMTQSSSYNCHFHHARVPLSRLVGAPPPSRFSLAILETALQHILCANTHARNNHHDANATAQPIPKRDYVTNWRHGGWNNIIAVLIFDWRNMSMCSKEIEGRHSSTSLRHDLRESSHRPQHSSGKGDVKCPITALPLHSFQPRLTR